MISTTTILWIAACAIGGYFLYHGYCWLDSRRENRRRKAAKLGMRCSQYGAHRLASVFIAYSVGDYSGLWAEIRKMCDAIEDGVDVLSIEFNAIADAILAERSAKAAA